jgi:hypothetical protein
MVHATQARGRGRFSPLSPPTKFKSALGDFGERLPDAFSARLLAGSFSGASGFPPQGANRQKPARKQGREQ